MLTKMTARQARDNFTDLLGSVYYGREQVAVEKKGRIFAVVINPDEYQVLKTSAKRIFFELAGDLHTRNRRKNPAQVWKDVSEAVEKARSARYARIS